jgi:hypothetical protein
MASAGAGAAGGGVVGVGAAVDVSGVVGVGGGTVRSIEKL